MDAGPYNLNSINSENAKMEVDFLTKPQHITHESVC